jgi:hypothetical protein
MEDKVKPGQIYKHYKGDTYKIITLAKHSETREWMVVYDRMTDIVHQGWTTQVRPLDMFLENVEVGDYKGPRFQYIEG